LHLSPKLAPVKIAIFPLMKKEPLVEKARTFFEQLRKLWNVQYDEGGAIGKRYRRHDEIGTPICLTIDFQTLDDDTVTLRNRDTMAQERVHRKDLLHQLSGMI
jgi:glycyl-tRNA synthetase